MTFQPNQQVAIPSKLAKERIPSGFKSRVGQVVFQVGDVVRVQVRHYTSPQSRRVTFTAQELAEVQPK